jgi:hypothetical protein
MRYTTTGLLVALLALGACGGGGSSSNPGNGGPAPIPAPPASGTPTATITNTITSAGVLAKTGASGSEALLYSNSINGVPLPFVGGVTGANPTTSVATPAGIITSGNTLSCGVTGTMSVTFRVDNGNVMTAGDSATIVFTNCAFTSELTVNGTITLTIVRYVSTTDYAVTMQVANFTSVGGGVTEGPFNFTGTVDFNNNTITYSYNVNGVTVVGQPVMVVSSTQTTINSGVIHVFYDTGWVEVAYNNWVIDSATGKPVSGMLTITAANGDTAMVTVVGGNYQVDIAINGVLTSHTVAI